MMDTLKVSKNITHLTGRLGSSQHLHHLVGVHLWVNIPQEAQGVSDDIPLGQQHQQKAVEHRVTEICLREVILAQQGVVDEGVEDRLAYHLLL